MREKDVDSIVWTVAEVGKILRLSRGATYEAIRSKQIPSIQIGRRILIPRAALERLVDGTNNSSTTL